MATIKGLRNSCFNASPFSEYFRGTVWGLHICVECNTVNAIKGSNSNMKNKNYLVEWEGTFVDSMGIKSVPYIWKNFCSRFLWLSVLPWWRERPLTAMFWLEWLARLKVQATGFDAYNCHFFQHLKDIDRKSNHCSLVFSLFCHISVDKTKALHFTLPLKQHHSFFRN